MSDVRVLLVCAHAMPGDGWVGQDVTGDIFGGVCIDVMYWYVKACAYVQYCCVCQ